MSLETMRICPSMNTEGFKKNGVMDLLYPQWLFLNRITEPILMLLYKLDS